MKVLAFFVIILRCFISQIVNAFEATEMCVEHGLLCAAALGVSVFYCERNHFFMSVLPYVCE
jgi:hypothetical protein